MSNILKLFMLFCVIWGLGSCTDENSTLSERFAAQHLTLQLPNELNVEIGTRAIDENSVNDVLAVVIRNGVAKCETFIQPSITDKTLSLELQSISPILNEKLYIFCNTGLTSINATTEEELLEEVTCTNTQTSVIMYGTQTIIDIDNIMIGLQRILSKAELSFSSSLTGYSIESWEVCNVPSAGYVMEAAGYPVNATFSERVSPDGNCAYFLPRTDNDSIDVQPKTFILLKLSGLGWYRLDFYDGTSFLSIERNTHYSFTITSVKSDGYATSKEAEENVGSNIEYEIETVYNGPSNGQYLLQTNKDEIILYPVGIPDAEVSVLEISAIIPKPSLSNITTYTVTLVNPSKQITMISSADLYEGTALTTENSKRTVRFSFDGADTHDSYLEIKLGNLKKKVPIRILSSNSYLADFGTTAGVQIFIPLEQANMDGTVRIAPGDLPHIETEIIWSDQPDIDKKLTISFDNPEKMWMKVINKEAFTGNVVIAAKLNGVICWSWHIWALDNSVLEYNGVFGTYDFKTTYTNTFNDFVWMDRNLGALNINNPSDRHTRGLMYQWGRKDPFPGSDTDLLTEPAIYSGMGVEYRLTGSHPLYGNAIIVPVADDKLKYSIENPMRFMKNPVIYDMPDRTKENDWYSSNITERKNDFWNLEGNKGIYDPCPVGWRVPVLEVTGPWIGLWPSSGSINASGVTWGDAGYYPWASRRTVEGTLTLINSEPNTSTLWWGSGDDRTLINSTRIEALKIQHLASASRGSGQLVRCVRE